MHGHRQEGGANHRATGRRPPPMTRPDPLHQALAAAPPGSLAVVGEGGLARALLAEAALPGGGALLSLPGGREALVGVAPGPGTRVAAAIRDMLGTEPRLLNLPLDRAALLALAEAPPARPESPAGPRLTLLHDAAGVPRGQLLSPAPGEREAACRDLLAALTDPRRLAALPALRPGLRLFLECPEDAPANGGPALGRPDDSRAPVAVLPLAALARPDAFAARAAALRQGGWQVGVIAPAAEGLDWMPGGDTWALAPPGAAPPAALPPRLALLGPRPAWAPPEALSA